MLPLALLLACKPPDVEVAPTAAPTVWAATWTSSSPTTAHVRFGLDGAPALASPLEAAPVRDHRHLLLGLKGGRTYTWEAVEVDGDAERVIATGTLTVDPPPADLTGVTVSSVDEGRMEPGGYVLTSQMSPEKSYVLALDRDGDPVWWWPAEERLSIPTSRPSIRGGVAFTHNDAQQATDMGGNKRVSLDGSTEVLTRAWLGHHDFVELPDGGVAWLSVEIREAEIDGETMLVGGDVVSEAPEGATEESQVVRRFSFFDDYPLAPWRTCEHFDAELFSTGARDWTHCNSLMYDEAEDDFLVMCKNLDALLRVDRQTGALVWQMGGLLSDFAADDPRIWWSHAHMSHVWDGGLAVFDNGYHHDPVRSRAVEYATDEEGRALELVWQYRDPDARFVPLLGDVRRLPGGTRLVSWTSAGLLTEVDGTDVVWRAEADLGSAFGRVTWVGDLYDLLPD